MARRSRGQARRPDSKARGSPISDAGSGAFARTQIDHAATALLVDIALAEDLKRHPKVTAIEGSLLDVLPNVPTASLDIVLCLSVLEHLWEPR